MSDGALAGTVVGVVVGVGLLALCLYPVIVYHIKRRRRPRRPHLDAENGVAAHHEGPHLTDLSHHRHLSSSDSLKRNDFALDGPRSKQWPLAGHEKAEAHTFGGNSRPQRSPLGPCVVAFDGSRAATQTVPGEYGLHAHPSSVPFYAGEYMPVSEVRDEHPGVLRGTSADYYSPSIPSEAFGMVAIPTDVPVAVPRASRGSSFKYNIRHVFRRPGSRDRTDDSYTCAPSAGDSLPASYGAHVGGPMTMDRMDRDLTESPTDVSPTIAAPATSGPAP